MTSFNRDWIATHYVQHRYRRGHKGYRKCIRCGVKRRRTSSGWEYASPDITTVSGALPWTSENPPCVKRSEKP